MCVLNSEANLRLKTRFQGNLLSDRALDAQLMYKIQSKQPLNGEEAARAVQAYRGLRSGLESKGDCSTLSRVLDVLASLPVGGNLTVCTIVFNWNSWASFHRM